ncbi:hypothetical protein GXP67_33590 [Rhodocytophaga rosea]|uniref:Tetratricopeptide repeat protein n=1 Tax=Rhodocytophaga rosea TaxID=2704465 RepID=A0A6C0GTK9_9BACT|nr:hypothetical protein [Rhodocytophaga rosea]QHT71237.1 hypothetical protein GXP67_33590 [Rhodocytophaga rosea]
MSDLFFWKQWPASYRNIYLTSLAVSTIGLVIYLIWFFTGNDAVIGWQTRSELQSLSLQLNSFSRSLFNFTVETPSYFITEQFVASLAKINTLAVYIYLAFLTGACLLVLSLITELPRLWYILGMGVFILLLASFKFDLLQVFGLRNNTVFIVSVAAYAGLSYYFHAFQTEISFQLRLASFTVLTVVLALLIIFFSRSAYPLITLAGNGIIIPVGISLVFIFMVSHEIEQGFLYLVTQSGGIGGKNSLLHFSLISLIYIINLGLLYARNAGFISWDFFYINPFYLLLISAAIGIWGYKKRNVLFDHIISFYPNGAFLYLALATVSLATIGYFFASGNDSMLEMIEDIIVFSHLAMGVSFFIYVFINFRSPMSQGLLVYKVVYQPRQYPFFIARGVALLIILAFFFRANMYPMYHAFSGYYNVIADTHTLQGEQVLAEQYYKLSIQYSFQNHKANYALASQARLQNDAPTAIFYLKQAQLKNPTAYTYGSLSNVYLEKGLFFDAIFNLQQGVQSFPRSGELYNNLALLYGRSNIADSAYIYHQLADKYVGVNAETSQTNRLAFWIKNNSLINTDSLLESSSASNSVPLQANRLLLSNMHGLKSSDFLKEFLPADSILSEETFAYLFNHVLNAHTPYDSTLANYLLGISKKDGNVAFSENLQFALACYEYYKNDRSKALELVANVSMSSNRAAYFSKIAGLWFLQQQAPKRAGEFFLQAIQAGDSSLAMKTNQAVAFSENGQWLNALASWQPLATSPDPSTRSLAKYMETISGALLSGQEEFVSKALDDRGKSLMVYFSRGVLLPDVALSITNPEYRVQTLVNLAEKCIAIDSVSFAATLLEKARETPNLSQTLQNRLHALDLQLLLATRAYPQVLSKAKSLSLNPEDADRSLLWQAQAFGQTNQPKEASRLYALALKRMPADTAVILEASRFFNTVRKKPDLAYSTLLEATLLNPYNPEIQKAYILQCLDMQLLSYAENAMSILQQIATDADYQSFLPVYEARKSSVEKILFEWK